MYLQKRGVLHKINSNKNQTEMIGGNAFWSKCHLGNKIRHGGLIHILYRVMVTSSEM